MNRVIVITGASTGIGRALALAWARTGATIVLNARDEVSLARVAREVTAAGGVAFVEAGDVTDEAHRQKLIDRALHECGRIDVLVNNAGRGYYGAARNIDVGELTALFALNACAPLRLSQLALEPLARTRGTIVMISSVAGVVAAPRMGAYAATKFALEALSASLRAEVASSGIRVLVARPGPVDTGFRTHAITTDGTAGVRPKGAGAQTAERVAEQIVHAVATGRTILETSLFVRVASFTARVTPRAFLWITQRMARREH